MRKPSRNMPSPHRKPATSIDRLIAALWGLGVVTGFLAMLYNHPISTSFLMVVVLLISAWTNFEEGRKARRAKDRPSDSICTFVRAMDYRSIDTWIIRATYEEMKSYTGLPHVAPSDDLHDDLHLDPEEWDFLAEDIALRAGRSMENCDRNPLYEKVRTVGDLIMVLMRQPKIIAA